MLGSAVAVSGCDRGVVGTIDRHHDVLGDSTAIVVVDDDGRGNREAFADAKEVELVVDDAVAPVDFAGIGVAGLSADCERCLQRCDLVGGQLATCSHASHPAT